MVNYNPDLQGWSDRDEDPHWMENAIARVRARQAGKKPAKSRKSGTWIYYDVPFRVLLDEAAKRRGIGMTGYVRRATAAFIAKDLGMAFTEVIRHTAKPKGIDERVPQTPVPDNGQGYGAWLIQGLSER
jgi:hypothetical protein